MLVIATVINADIEVRVDEVFLKKFSRKLFSKYIKTPRKFENKNQIDRWLCEIEAKVASKHVYQLLSYKSYPSHLLLQKLMDGGIRQCIAQNQINKLKELGYIDDDAFIEYLIKKEIKRCYGPRYIRLKLLSKHFCSQVIDDKLQKLESENEQKKRIEKIYEKLKKLKNEKQIYQYFIRKGFDNHLIQQIIKLQEK